MNDVIFLWEMLMNPKSDTKIKKALMLQYIMLAFRYLLAKIYDISTLELFTSNNRVWTQGSPKKDCTNENKYNPLSIKNH